MPTFPSLLILIRSDGAPVVVSVANTIAAFAVVALSEIPAIHAFTPAPGDAGEGSAE